MEKPIPIEKFNFGGLADSKYSGIKNSLYKMIGFDPHSTPGLLKVAQKLTKNSASTVTEFCKARVNSSNGAQYWGSSTSGKIWECTSAGVWQLVHTLTPAAGTAYVLGMCEYQGYIYIATQSRLHRITVANADDNDWATDCVEDWATFTITDANFHPMLNHTGQLVLYIGDGNYLAQVDAGVFTANALDIKTPLRIKSLGELGTDILIGTYIADTVTRTEIIRWNGWSVSFTNSDSIDEVGINAFLPADNFTFVQAGLAGNIYLYNGEKLELYKKILGDYSPTKYGEVYPDSVANLGGEILFGFSNGSGNPTDCGVYRLGHNSRGYPYIMDLPYPISERSAGEFVLTSIEVGGILAVGSNLFVAWKNGSSYGIDKLDYSNKLDGAYFETRVMAVDREIKTNMTKILAAYASLPADTYINFYIDKNYAGYGSVLSKVNDTQRCIVVTKDEMTEFNTLQLKVKITASSNNAPEIESAAVFITQ